MDSFLTAEINLHTNMVHNKLKTRKLLKHIVTRPKFMLSMKNDVPTHDSIWIVALGSMYRNTMKKTFMELLSNVAGTKNFMRAVIRHLRVLRG